MLPSLRIRLKHHADRSASITLTRDDGSVTWQRQPGSLALVFPQHDLTHYAVEQTLQFQQGFYGLVADGWAISDFAKPWPRGPIPVEAREVEMLVGLFDGMGRERTMWDAVRLNLRMQALVADSKFADQLTPRIVSDDAIAGVSALRSTLLARWAATAPGDALELRFERGTR